MQQVELVEQSTLLQELALALTLQVVLFLSQLALERVQLAGKVVH